MDDFALVEYLPDVQELFKLYNEKFFNNILLDVKLEWSDKMTLCAGICMLRRSKKTQEREVTVRLSRPLLQLRPFSDTIDTLLHEMIHAFHFVVKGGSLDRDGHGEDFCEIMKEINSKEGTHITIYHSFHDEVNHYKKHVWRCTGSCKARPPFFGWVKRSMNRKPQPADSWWSTHQASCGGTFIKISGPEMKASTAETKISSFAGVGRTWSLSSTTSTSRDNKKLRESELEEKKIEEEPTSIKKKSKKSLELDKIQSSSQINSKITEYFTIDDSEDEVMKCFNCSKFETFSHKLMNDHLDSCLEQESVIYLDE